MNPRLFLRCFLIIPTFFAKNSYSSDFHVISTTERPTKSQTNQEDVAKLCLSYVENNLLGIEHLLEHIRDENRKHLQEMENSYKKQQQQLQDENKKHFQEMKNSYNNQQQPLQDKMIKQLEKIESEVTKCERRENSLKQLLDKIENKIEAEDKVYQQLETKINRMENKQQLEVVESQLEKINENILTMINSVNLPESCLDVKRSNVTESGVYTIRPKKSTESFKVLCDFTTKGGGWIYMMNRFDGSQDFFLGWEDYKNGFGSLSGEFWLGLKYVRELSNYKQTELLVELIDWNNVSKYALYDNFKVIEDNFLLVSLGRYSGDAGDDLRKHDGGSWYFKTKDKTFGSSCPNICEGGWWYRTSGDPCWSSHLTGRYYTGQQGKNSGEKGMTWPTFTGRNNSLKKARMLIRLKN